MDVPYQYNAIFGRWLLDAFYTVPHHGLLCMEMPGPRGTIKVLGNQELARLIEISRAPGHREVNELASASEGGNQGPTTTRYIPRAHPEREVKIVPLHPGKPERSVQLAADLTEQMEADLLTFLWENEDVFAWTPSDLQGIDWTIIKHHLNINLKKKP